MLARSLLFCSALLIITGFANADSMPKGNVVIGKQKINVEIAANSQDQELGLMHRTHLPEQSGMLFVFDTENSYCMWMKNTLIPLSVAFIDGNAKIINVEKMQPQTLNTHCSSSPKALYALEMNLNWFEKNKVKAGDKVEFMQKTNAKAYQPVGRILPKS